MNKSHKKKKNGMSAQKEQDVKGCIDELEYVLHYLKEYQSGSLTQKSLSDIFHYNSNKMLRQIRNRFKEYLTKDAETVFSTEMLSQLLCSMESPSHRILKDVFGIPSDTLCVLPPYDETLFWENYIQMLPAHEQTILKALYTETNLSMEQIGKRNGYTKQGISVMRQRILEKLRNPKQIAILFQETTSDGIAIQDMTKQIRNIVTDMELEQNRKQLQELRRKIDRMLDNVTSQITQNVLDTNITDCQLSTRTTNALLSNGCRTVQDAIEKYPDYDSIKNIQNIGRKSAEELFNFLRSVS